MTRGPAQAGNRASKTGHYLQWWEHGAEWDAVTAAVGNCHNSTLLHFHPFAFTIFSYFSFCFADKLLDELMGSY